MIKNFNEWLLENEGQEPKDPETHEEVKALLDKLGVKNYTINDDLTVDVNAHVNLDGQLKRHGFNKIPIKFKRIRGQFDIDHNDLISIKGLAEGFMTDVFYCQHNSLTTLEGLPEVFNLEVVFFNYSKGVGTPTLNMLGKEIFNEGLTWKKAIIKHIDAIPDYDWKSMTLEGKLLPSKEEFKKKYVGIISSKRLGL